MSYCRTVTKIIDGDSFVVDESIQHGISEVRIAGYSAPEYNQPRGSTATAKLSNLILKKEVSLDVKAKSYDRLVCDVFLNGENIADIL